ncbi:LOW QUALITY PROTEIN: glucose-6-phosphate exchanger SLC37A2-like [Macrobrachium rosenbergii]|uniref:LOW QUALITY PROTEIN: glucose-6-phosphate exchanger SLC37A2-like n=1 Tax=Macrobrachium rosenbergii TaxID=79674 RepID=UPI0034D535B3
MAKLSPVVRWIDGSCCGNVSEQRRILAYKAFILIVTFFIYCTYHLSRKPISIVKTVLNQNCTNKTDPNHTNNTHWCDWKPFDDDNSQTLLGFVDSAFLFAYAFGMFFSGVIAERMDLRLFLSVGMILSAIFNVMFGLGYTFNIHVLSYYLAAQALSGIVQASGWPGVVAVVGNWFGKGSRGLIFGIWNSHTSLGNILGSVIAAAFVSTAWSLSFIVPGLIIGGMGIIVFFLLVPEPSLLGLPNPNSCEDSPAGVSPPPRRRNLPVYAEGPEEERASLLDNEESPVTSYTYNGSEKSLSRTEEEKAINYFSALKIPGVVEFSLCLFFAKLVSYTFLYWLPNYIKNSTSYSPAESGNLSTLFDVGGIIGAITAGILRDRTGMPACTCAVMLIMAVPMMFVYHLYGDLTFGFNVFLLIVVGILVNGPYALITTAVSADLGTHESIRGNAKALATVSSIIDGTGSIGAAVGPLIAGPVSQTGWGNVFYMLMGANVLALMLLTRLVIHEVKGFLLICRQGRQTSPL